MWAIWVFRWVSISSNTGSMAAATGNTEIIAGARVNAGAAAAEATPVRTTRRDSPQIVF
jgi:hypothetical protein